MNIIVARETIVALRDKHAEVHNMGLRVAWKAHFADPTDPWKIIWEEQLKELDDLEERLRKHIETIETAHPFLRLPDDEDD